MKLEIVGAYPVPEAEEPCHLVEWRLSDYIGPFEIGKLVQPEPGQPPENWQVPWAEYLLSADGTSGESAMFGPIDVSGEARFCFFYFYLQPGVPFSTPFGPVLEPGELLTTVRVPPPAEEARSAFLKFTVREPIDFAVVSVAASITLRDGVCVDARLVLGAVGPRPYRAVEAEAGLIGGPVDHQVAAEAADAAVAAAKSLRGNAYKLPLVRALVQRALLEAAAT